MKICVSAITDNLDSPVDPRFGRCRYFIIVEADTMQFEAVPNTAGTAMHGAGIQAAQIVASKGVNMVITGNVGPNAYQALTSAGVKVVGNTSGTVREVVEQYKKGDLTETKAPTVGGHFGSGRGMGRGRQRGF